MPDWNPAEIVGVRPRPLSLSLYRELVTDNIWAYQRYKYGYRDVRSFPLVIDFEGLPYVDVRVSFNSFVPRDLKPPIADRLVDYYTAKLIDAPALHDKVEFDIVFSCYTADLPLRAKVLEQHGFTAMDVGHIAEVLRLLTNRIMGRRDGFWQEDVARTRMLEQRRQAVINSSLPDVEKLFWLLEDCKRYGTLPFAGLARCAFIATQILHSLVALGVFDQEEHDRFLGSLDTVSARMTRDLATLPIERFLDQYGHLRPGTYDIMSARYDEAPERYFDTHRAAAALPTVTPFTLSGRQQRAIDSLLHDHGIDYDAGSLLQFVRTSIEAREDAKFVFTRSLSDALALIERVGAACRLDRDAMSFVTIGALREAVAQSSDLSRILGRAVAEGQERWDVARRILLPPLLIEPEDVFSFHVPPSEPNFVTQLTASGPVVDAEISTDGLEGSIVLIRSADPGWDWILTRNIKAFVTQYGGANSHMAVRAHQLGLPAVVGAGEALFERCRRARRVLVDCPNHQIRVLS
jgi:phosphohistidine swiveling domain-containing protein